MAKKQSKIRTEMYHERREAKRQRTLALRNARARKTFAGTAR